jgi:hypothetical protein
MELHGHGQRIADGLENVVLGSVVVHPEEL